MTEGFCYGIWRRRINDIPLFTWTCYELLVDFGLIGEDMDCRAALEFRHKAGEGDNLTCKCNWNYRRESRSVNVLNLVNT